MRIVTEIIEIYTFDDASPELRDKIRDYFHSDGYHYEHCMFERIDTLKKLAEILGGKLDYSLSCVPDRGEFIEIKPLYNEGLDFASLWEVIDQEKECPLTGCYYDHDIIDQLTLHTMTNEGLQNALDSFIDDIHKEYEFMLTDEYLSDLCEANEYEFTIDGKLY